MAGTGRVPGGSPGSPYRGYAAHPKGFRVARPEAPPGDMRLTRKSSGWLARKPLPGHAAHPKGFRVARPEAPPGDTRLTQKGSGGLLPTAVAALLPAALAALLPAV